jgi:hypothetical protein
VRLRIVYPFPSFKKRGRFIFLFLKQSAGPKLIFT